MFRSAVSTFRSGERTFRSGERTLRSAEHKPNTLQRYIKTRYYANIYPTIFIHLQRVSSGQRRVRGRQDNPEHNLPLIIRDEAMNNFINLTQ